MVSRVGVRVEPKSQTGRRLSEMSVTDVRRIRVCVSVCVCLCVCVSGHDGRHEDERRGRDAPRRAAGAGAAQDRWDGMGVGAAAPVK